MTAPPGSTVSRIGAAAALWTDARHSCLIATTIHGVVMEVSLFTVGVVVLLLVLSAFFSGSETGLTAASQARMHHLALVGDRRARAVNRLRENKDRLLGALLLGNNLVNILASALTTSILLGLFGDAGIAYATIGMTMVVLVFSEVLPKTYAIRHADKVALTVAPVVRILVAITYPVTLLITAIVGVILRLIGQGGPSPALVSSDELRGAIELQGGSQEQRAMLRSVLDLTELAVSEIMIPRVRIFSIDLDNAPGRIIDAMLASPYTRIPLWRGTPENVLGVLHAKALLKKLREPGVDVDTLDILALASKPMIIPTTTTLANQLRAFRESRSHLAIIMDEYGGIAGLVTIEDILEEIVGEIYDEHDRPHVITHHYPDGSQLIPGDAVLRDLNRQYGWSLPDDTATTMAGLVMAEAKAIPLEGETVTLPGFRIMVTKRKGPRLLEVRLWQIAPGQDETGTN